MHPFTVGVVLSVFLVLGLVQYKLVPPSLNQSLARSNSSAVADFDWCEENYRGPLPFVAEMWNSATSFAYVVVGAYFMGSLVPRFLPAEFQKNFIWLGCATIVTGVGSILFHGTLRYDMQLVDELGMLSMTMVVMLVLCPPPRRPLLQSVYCVLLAWCILVLFSTDKFSRVHSGTHMAMSILYTVHFLYIFIGGAIVSNRISRHPDRTVVQQYFTVSFWCFIAAIITWLLDNTYCKEIRQLFEVQWGVMYPQLHALGWHLGTSLGVYYYSVMVLCCTVVEETAQGNTLSCGFNFFGLPVLKKVVQKSK